MAYFLESANNVCCVCQLITRDASFSDTQTCIIYVACCSLRYFASRNQLLLTVAKKSYKVRHFSYEMEAIFLYICLQSQSYRSNSYCLINSLTSSTSHVGKSCTIDVSILNFEP